MKRIGSSALVAVVAWALAGCGGGLKDPETAVRMVVEKELQWEKDHLGDGAKAVRQQIEVKEKELEWHADRGKYAQEIDYLKAGLEFAEDNLGKIRDSYTYDIINIKQPDPNNDSVKVVTVKVWHYAIQMGNGPKDFYLDYVSEDKEYTFKKGDKGWKLQKGYKPAFERG